MTQTPAIEIEKLAFRYPDGTLALDHVDLTIGQGERVALVGPNGAGKSTLLRHLNGVFLPGHGSVRVRGVNVEKGTLDEVRQSVGLVFQDPDDQLFSPTVYDDIAFGPRNQGLSAGEVDARVRFAMDLMGLAAHAKKPAHHLSFGQRKRVATATVISMMPAVWAFDEPSSNLDPRTQRLLEEFLNARDETVVIVTQDLLFAAATCHRMVVLSEGRVVADGALKDLLRDAPLLERHGLDFTRHCIFCRELRESE